MGTKRESSRARPRLDSAAKTNFLAALRSGAARDEAAKAAGFSANAFYGARRADPVFALAWAWAADLSAADAHSARRAAAPLPGPDEVDIRPNANRILQARPVRRATFDDRRKRLFLDHFAGTADVTAAADAAGVSVSAVTRHRRTDPEFAAGCEEALAICYAALEAEAVRQRLAAQRDFRAGIVPKGELPCEFDRVLRLLARYERKTGRIGLRERAPGREARWSFDDAIALLDKKLRALGARRGLALPPPPEERPEE